MFAHIVDLGSRLHNAVISNIVKQTCYITGRRRNGGILTGGNLWQRHNAVAGFHTGSLAVVDLHVLFQNQLSGPRSFTEVYS